MNLLDVITAQVKRRSAIIAAFLLGVLVAALCFAALTFFQTDDVFPSWRYYGAFLVVGAGITALMCLRYRLKIAVCTGMGFLVSILLLLYYDYDAAPTKAFRRLDAAIHHGMTLAEVRSAVQREFPEHGWFPVPVMFESVPGTQNGDEVVYSDDSNYVLIRDRGSILNDITVSLHNGRVVDKHSNLAPGPAMFPPSTLAIVGVVVGLFGWACARGSPGVKARAGHGLDASSIAERLECVRRDHLGEYHTRRHTAGHRRGLLASAGLALRRFPYFRARAVEGSEDSEDERENA